MTKSYHLSPEVLEEIFIHTLDYSYQLNNLQLKRLQLVSKVFNGVATRLLYRWIVLSKHWAANQLYRTLIAKTDLRTLVRSIFFLETASLQPKQETKLLALLPTCTSFLSESDSDHIITIDSKGTYTPSYPTNERLVLIRTPRIKRNSPSPPPGGPGYHIPPYRNRNRNPPVHDASGDLIPLIKPDSAVDHLASLPQTFQHLAISGRNVKDFEVDEESSLERDDQGTLIREKFPLKELVSIKLHKVEVGWRQICAMLEPSMKSKTLTSLQCHDLSIYIHEITLRLVALYGSSSLRELALYTYEPNLGFEVKTVNLSSLRKLEVLALTDYSKEISWNQLPPNLRDLSIHKNNKRFRRSEILALVLALSQPGLPNLRSFSIIDDRPPIPPRRSFPRTTPLQHHPLSLPRNPGLERLRIEGVIPEAAALESLLKFCSSTLRYLALLNIGILVPWTSIARCRSLRWLELGSLDKFLNGEDDSDVSDDSDEDSEVGNQEKKEPQDATYAGRRRKAQFFLDTTFPHLDYLHLHVGDSFSLFDVANQIQRNRWPSIKVIDFEGLQRGGLYEDEDIEEENGKGLEELFGLSKSRGITICAGGTPLQGLGDLWRYMLNKKTWHNRDSEDDLF